MAWYDNLMTGLMPGETYGVPDNTLPQAGGFQGQVGGLLSGENPLFNLGLGILANNNSRNFGQVIGRGAQQGMQMTQQQQQLARQNKMSDLQAKRYERDDKRYDAEEAAHNAFDTKFPQYKGLSRLDPKSAFKIANPDFANNTADPFFQPIPTEQGLGKFNARTGQFELLTDPTGKPIIKTSDSPTIQGQIASAKSYGENLYQPTDMQPGVIKTKSQLAIDAGAPQPQLTPQIPAGTPMLPQNVQGNFNGNPQAIMSQINRIRDPQERASATAAFNQQFGQQPVQAAPMSNSYGGGGVRVPTPIELEQAKADIQAAKELKVTAGTIDAKDKGLVNSRKDALYSVQKARGLLDKGIYTGAYANVGKSIAKYTPGMDKTKAANTETFMAEIGNTVIPRLQEFGGNDSNEEMRYLKSIMGGDITAEPEAIRSVLESVEAKIQRGIDRANQGLDPNGRPATTQSPAKVRKYNPKTGRIE